MLSKLGTWTTIDCPTKKIDEAFHFLTEEFEKIGGKVYKKMNPHDFGAYPSFEIDYPKGMEDIEEDDGTKSFLREECLVKEEWEAKANDIEDEYGKKFSEYL